MGSTFKKVDVSKAFSTSSDTILDFFQRPGVGFYIPLYQRDYSWDEENIDQLMDDICRGVESLINSDDRKLRFLGTIILVKESNPDSNIQPRDKKALPITIHNVIDGQQRISTIAILACILYQRIWEISEKISDDLKNTGIQEVVNDYLANLTEIFSFDLRRGNPQRKPIIIRGSVDNWTLDGDIDSNYKSGVSSFLAKFIEAISSDKATKDFPKRASVKSSNIVDKNIKKIIFSLNSIEKAHESNSDEDQSFPWAREILDKIPEKLLWSYERPELIALVPKKNHSMSDNQKMVCSLIQLFAFCHYLLERSCLTWIEPISEEWAFDMFQSLNATGTPLTALETFKPLVVNSLSSQEKEFKSSKIEEYWTLIDKLFKPLTSASSKSQLTNEFLTVFGTTYNGGKEPSRQFSSQRRWLTEQYTKCTLDKQEEFIHIMSDLASYWLDIIKPDKKDLHLPFEEISAQQKKECTLCILYLRDANHKMSNTILSRFYSQFLRNQLNAAENFVDASKAITAFYTLWRSALDNKGLDEVYRRLLKTKMSWKYGNEGLTIDNLREHFRITLNEQGIGNKKDWQNKATQYLRYQNVKVICKFVLFLTAHDTIPDHKKPGLMKQGKPGYCCYLDPDLWLGPDLKSIEHIAPQNPNNIWDQNLYSNNDDYDQIGNLTLLPVEINSSASNKGWVEKWLYYKYLIESDPDNENLKQFAEQRDIVLDTKTIKRLLEANYKRHLESIVTLGADAQWNQSIVEERTKRICDIVWDRLYKWLE